MRVFAVGLGPGSIEYTTAAAVKIIQDCDVVIGYGRTLDVIRSLISDKEVIEVTMTTQEEAYQKILKSNEYERLLVPFTGDANFSESEVVDRLFELFHDVTIVPGISSVQVAAAKTAVPLDRAAVITMHVTGSIQEQKKEMLEAITRGKSAIVIPRPWPRRPEKNFMPSDVACYLKDAGIDTPHLRVVVFENLTMPDEAVFAGMTSELEGKTFSDMCVMVFPQHRPDSYMNYTWQWKS